ncbi:MAG TPA: aconitate hydratase AcnA [Kofleriaceae bacterium]|nr:aconitate hydratase AcnA [Kofleriaceae bacterium]
MANVVSNSFGTEGVLEVAASQYTICRLGVLARQLPEVERLPYALKILLENLLRHEDGAAVSAEDIEALARWRADAEPSREVAFTPSRVLHQDFTGVPSLVDLAAMRDAMRRLGGDPGCINPRAPVELVIDHSVQVDDHGRPESLRKNAELELLRNAERYRFLRWGQRAFQRFQVVPPGMGICHQVNLEHLARVVFTERTTPRPRAYPDTVVGTDSHTTMVNGLGVLGWGCGGIEAEAAMLGQPISMLIPQVIGVELVGRLPHGATATDLVLSITQLLRRRGVVGAFVEFFGEGLLSLSLADRATVANMAPEYGATCGMFPIDAETLRYLRLTGRPEERVRLVEAYAKEQGLFWTANAPAARYTDIVALDLGAIEPCLAGPTRPQDRVRLPDVARSFQDARAHLRSRGAASPAAAAPRRAVPITLPGTLPGTLPDAHDRGVHDLADGAVVLAAITSCTNTSNPALLFAAGLLARNAVARGLSTKPWVKTSLAPGSRVVTDYLARAGLARPLEALGFFLVGYGCTTCVGNSGPLPAPISKAIAEHGLVVAAVLSGNRNFEGRVHPEVRANYLASPPLVVAYALAGRVDIDLTTEPLGRDPTGEPVYLADLWPSREEIAGAIDRALSAASFKRVYADVFSGDERWAALAIPEGELFAWPESTYVKSPPYFVGMTAAAPAVAPITGARVLALLGDSITTDHISPAGTIKVDSPAGKYLLEHGVAPRDFNAYGARRGNHEVMVRGTFANVRLQNRLAPGTEGGFTRHLPDGEVMAIFDAAERYRAAGVPLLVIAGKEYGTGSSRDWAAKGTRLLGVRAVLAESFERIHRSNLIGMGVLPLQFQPGEGAATLGLSGDEVYEVVGLAEALASGRPAGRAVGRPVGRAAGRAVTVRAERPGGVRREFAATVRIDTPQEILYYTHGGILPYVLRQLLAAQARAA